MNKRMIRTLGVAIGLLSLAEVLLLHWATMAFAGGGLDGRQSLVSLVGVGLFNVLAFPAARRRLHESGLALVASRSWVMGSVAALLTGCMLAVVFAYQSRRISVAAEYNLGLNSSRRAKSYFCSRCRSTLSESFRSRSPTAQNALPRCSSSSGSRMPVGEKTENKCDRRTLSTRVPQGFTQKSPQSAPLMITPSIVGSEYSAACRNP